MDPLSITASTLGITQFAISSIVQLNDFINNFADAKEVAQDIASNLEGIQRPLAALEELHISDLATYTAAKMDLEKTGVVEAVNNCGQACANFTDNLKQWTKHSSGTRFSLRDRFLVGIWNKEKIRTFRMQVQSCQATAQFAIASTQL
jgi:Fungal N-terminal domain of STAND proteins